MQKLGIFAKIFLFGTIFFLVADFITSIFRNPECYPCPCLEKTGFPFIYSEEKSTLNINYSEAFKEMSFTEVCSSRKKVSNSVSLIIDLAIYYSLAGVLILGRRKNPKKD